MSLVDPESGHVTMIMQTMEYNLSQCFKDTHSPFSVAKQTASFQLTGLPSSVTTLQVRRTVLIAASPIDPIDPYTDLNSYFLKLDAITLGPGGTFTLELPINTVTTVTSLPSTADPIVPAIPPATAFTNFTSTLQGVSAGRGTPYLIDQQGVFVAAPSRLDASVTTLQQTIPAEPQEWHGSTKFTVPHTFVGPSALTANISVEVLPASGSQSFGAIGFNGQIGTKNEDTLLRVDENGKWHLLNNSGIATSASGWIRLALQVAGNGDYAAFVGQAQVATGSFGTPQGWFPTLGELTRATVHPPLPLTVLVVAFAHMMNTRLEYSGVVLWSWSQRRVPQPGHRNRSDSNQWYGTTSSTWATCAAKPGTAAWVWGTPSNV